MKQKKDALFAFVTAVVLAIGFSTYPGQEVYADVAGSDSTQTEDAGEVEVEGDVDGDGVTDEDEEGEVEGEEVKEENTATEGEGEETGEEEAEDKDEGEGEDDDSPWYRKYWWIILCPAVLVFFGLGVGVYYLVNWIKSRRK